MSKYKVLKDENKADIPFIYDQLNPGYTFEFGFVDEEYQALYESENRIAALSKYFAGLTALYFIQTIL